MLDTAQRPLLGAALTADELDSHRDWLFDQQRDLELQDFVDTELLDGDWRTRTRKIERQLQGYRGRLGLHGPFWGFTVDSHDAAIRAAVQRRLNQGIDVCAEIGATQMVIHSPFTIWDYYNRDNAPDSRERLRDRVRLCLEPVLIHAAEVGVTLVMENIEDLDPYERVTLARSFDTPHLRVSLDTGHAHYAHLIQRAPPVDYYVQAAGDLLAHVHLQDSDGYADRHWAIGEGSIPWPAVFRALTAAPTQPRLILELRNKDSLPRAAQFLVDARLAR